MALAVVQASAQTSPTLPLGAMATVNGVVLPVKRLDQLVQVNGSQGRQDTAQLRAALKAELIARELLLQEAQRRGIPNSADAEAALAQARESVLIDFLIQDEISKKPVTDAEVKAGMAAIELALKAEAMALLEARGTASPLAAGLALIAALLWACLAADRVLYPRHQLQAWLPMRLQLTLVASVCCLAGAAARV
mgnify:CR=1 FL=1